MVRAQMRGKPLNHKLKPTNTSKDATSTDRATSGRSRKYNKGAMGTKNINDDTEKKT